jgi:hypothetical protein
MALILAIWGIEVAIGDVRWRLVSMVVVGWFLLALGAVVLLVLFLAKNRLIREAADRLHRDVGM